MGSKNPVSGKEGASLQDGAGDCNSLTNPSFLLLDTHFPVVCIKLGVESKYIAIYFIIINSVEFASYSR